MKMHNLSVRDGKPAGRIRQKNEEIILQAAEVEFAAHGFKGATMNNIALRAELPKSNIHYYFKNKQQLYSEVLSNIIELWDTALNELTADDDPATALRDYVATKIQFSEEYPIASRLFAKEIASGAPLLGNFFDDEYRRWFKGRADVFREWHAQGKIDNVPAEHILFLIWSSTQHYADFAVQICAAMGKDELSKTDYKKAADTLSTVIIRGIGCKI